MKLPLEYFFLLLFPLVLVLPLPLITSSIALALGLLNVLALSAIRGNWKTFYFRGLGQNILVFSGALLLVIDSFTNLLRNLDIEFIVRDVRISFLAVPIILLLIKDKLKHLRSFLLFSLVIGVVIYIIYAYGYLTYFYANVITNRSFEFNHFFIYDLRVNVPGAYHHSYIGMYMTFSIAILLQHARKKHQLRFLALAIFILISQVVFGSKLSFALSFFLAVIYIFVQLKTNASSYKWVLVSLSLIIAIITGIIYKSDIMNSLFFSTTNRIDSWQCTLQGFFEKPYFGYGHEDSVTYLENCITTEAISTHNQYFEEFINYGLFGVWLPILFTLLFLKSKRDTLFRIFVILIVIVSFFENTLSLQRGVLFFIFFASLFYIPSKNDFFN